MPQISKQIIKDLIATLDSYGCGAHHPDLLPLLDQPEGEPVARLMTCKKPLLVSVETIARTYEEFPTRQAVSENFWAEGRPLYTRPAPFTPITADDVTDEMVEQFFKIPYDAARKDVFVAAVNAWGAKK